MQKTIFLDLDGVLNPDFYNDALYRMFRIAPEIKCQDDFGDLFFQHNCDALKKIIDETGASIVISSAWRIEGFDQMKRLWKHRQLSGKVIGVTPSEDEVAKSKMFGDQYICRGMEIKYWIIKNNYKGNYVIIDDAEKMLEEQKPFFVLTDTKIGLTFKDAEKAIKILNK